MKKTVFFTLLAAAVVFGFQRGPGVAARTSPFNEQRATADLKTLVDFGPRPAGSEALAKARNYIVAELEKAGLKPQLDEFDARTPRGFRHMINVRASRPGSKPTTIAVTILLKKLAAMMATTGSSILRAVKISTCPGLRKPASVSR